ncbi:unnamed protein product [Orchesella dallaii]|uniref:non-specific serine/threonine protein kinase n=1 Tax=Orchesella dallaii TaxID=48710 RepID=A0ABP1Q122_9HEXA
MAGPSKLILGPPVGGARRFKIQHKIGSGTFGEIHVGIDNSTGQQVAIKLENVKTLHPTLQYESRVYRYLQGGIGIPNLKWCGPLERSSSSVRHTMMVMELLGPCLEELFDHCDRRFSVKTVLMLADQMFQRLEYIHSRSFIHRDIKPDNFLMGVGLNHNKLYIIDFGLSKKYRDSKTKHHIPYRQDKNLTGTARYASLNAHQGIEQGRRDDMESIGYVLLYFLRGSLPWQGIRARSRKQKYDRIKERKMSTSIDDLCKDLPPEFVMYLAYCRGLRFDEAPDYIFVRQMFRTLFRSRSYQFDFDYDWASLNEEGEKIKAKKPRLELAPVKVETVTGKDEGN